MSVPFIRDGQREPPTAIRAFDPSGLIWADGLRRFCVFNLLWRKPSALNTSKALYRGDRISFDVRTGGPLNFTSTTWTWPPIRQLPPTAKLETKPFLEPKPSLFNTGAESHVTAPR